MEQEARFKTATVEIPEGVQVDIAGQELSIKGKMGEVKRQLHVKIDMSVKDGSVVLNAKVKGKKGKAIVGTWTAHVRNIVRGVVEGHTYKLKICSSHFPMTVAVDNGKITVKNFMGEKVPRVVDVIEGVEIKIEGQDITVKSVNKESAGNMASALEKMTRRTAYDRRVFQDGIYITAKDGKAIT